MREYGSTCFWDADYSLLDKYSEEELRNSDLNDRMGVVDKERSNIIKIPFKDTNGKSVNVKTKFLINPWDLEDE